MNKREFGQLIIALRKEHRDENDKAWSRKKLANETNLTEVIIRNIELGKKANFDDDTLLRLANALKLTSGERREFFLASTGIAYEKFVRESQEPLAVLRKLVGTLQNLQQPAFIADMYWDLIVVNYSLLHTWNISVEQLEAMRQNATNFNVLRFFLAPEFSYQHQMMGTFWPEIARYNILNFRMLTLQLRNNDYYRLLISEIRKYKKFRREWDWAYQNESDHFTGGGNMGLYLQQAPLPFVFSTVTSLTEYGNLHLCVYTPTSPGTMIYFNKMVNESGPGIVPLATWPEKKRPGQTWSEKQWNDFLSFNENMDSSKE
jgi:transcriptional regulator with XRE-family HTH domain